MRLTVILALLALVLASCARDVETRVTRFHGGKLPAGETFEVVPANPEMQGPEFQAYAERIRAEMRAYGYRPADRAPDLRVIADYGVSEGRTRITTYPGHAFPHYAFHVGRFHPLHHGFVSPRHFGGYMGPRIESEVVYTRKLRLRIVETATGETVFEGRALSEGPTQELSDIMPYLVESMFRNFPGESGATKVVEIETRDGRRY